LKRTTAIRSCARWCAATPPTGGCASTTCVTASTRSPQRLPLPTVQGYTGHAHISTTMRHVHHTPAARDVVLLSDATRASSSPLPAA
jgi:hypothetical protein